MPEIYSGQAWHRAKLRTSHGVLGAPPLKTASGVQTCPRSSATLTFPFSRLYFAVNQGNRLRVVVDTWSDEEFNEDRRSEHNGEKPGLQLPSQHRKLKSGRFLFTVHGV